MLLNQTEYQSSFDKAMACMVECEHCAQACLGISEMNDCVKKCLDCAEVCRTLATYMVRGSFFVAPLAEACIEICNSCAEECKSHDNSHCQKCAQACQQAVEVYQQIAGVKQTTANCCA